MTPEAVDAAKEGAQAPEQKEARRPRQSKVSGAQKKMIGRVQSACGLTALRGGHGLTVDRRAVVWFGRKSNPASRDDVIPLGDLSVGLLMGEKDGEWLRFAQLGGHLIDGHVLIGGGGFDLRDPQAELQDNEARNGWEGLWTTPAGQTYLRRDVPEDYEGSAFPEGLYKDISAPPRNRISAFSTHKRVARSNARVQQTVHCMLSLAEEQLCGKVEPFDRVQAPGILTAVERRMRLRALDGTFGTHQDAEELNQLTADCLQLGAWVIPQLRGKMAPPLVEGRTAVVKIITPQAIWLNADGEEFKIDTPEVEIKNFIHETTGLDATELVVAPLVTVDQLVSRDTCLFGPEAPQLFSAASLKKRVDECEGGAAKNRMRRLTDLEQVWALLTLATEHKNLFLYPVQYVVPSSPRQVFIRRTWGTDLSLQLIRLERSPLKLLKTVGGGFRINLWNISHREAQKKAWRERRDREAAEAREAVAVAAQQN